MCITPEQRLKSRATEAEAAVVTSLAQEVFSTGTGEDHVTVTSIADLKVWTPELVWIPMVNIKRLALILTVTITAALTGMITTTT